MVSRDVVLSLESRLTRVPSPHRRCMTGYTHHDTNVVAPGSWQRTNCVTHNGTICAMEAFHVAWEKRQNAKTMTNLAVGQENIYN
jgi:hypothetical protein